MDRVRRAFSDDDDLLKVGYAAAVGIIAGALGPWYSLPSGDILGTDYSGEGLGVLVLGAMGGVALYAWSDLPGRERLIGVAICAGGSLALMGYNALTVGEGVVGWGLVVGIASSILLLAVAARLGAISAT